MSASGVLWVGGGVKTGFWCGLLRRLLGRCWCVAGVALRAVGVSAASAVPLGSGGVSVVVLWAGAAFWQVKLVKMVYWNARAVYPG